MASCTRLPAQVRRLWTDDPRRDARIDLLRGLFVVVMIIDHTATGTVLTHVTGGGGRLFSAAEGFILLSGLTVGFVYPRVVARRGVGYAVRRLIRRGAIIYAVMAATGVAATAIILARASRLHEFEAQTDQVLTLRHPVSEGSLGLESILAIYAVLFALAPITILLLHRRKTPILVGLAVLAWSAQAFLPIGYRDSGLGDDIGGFVTRFSLLQGWAVWVIAAAIAWHRDRLVAVFRRLHPVVWIVGGIGVAALCSWLFPRRGAYWVLFEPPKLVVCAAAMIALFALVTIARDRLVAWTGWLLVPLGQQALVAVALHVMLLALPRPSLAFLGPVSQTALQVLAVAAIWLGTLMWLGTRRARRSPAEVPGPRLPASEVGVRERLAG